MCHLYVQKGHNSFMSYNPETHEGLQAGPVQLCVHPSTDKWCTIESLKHLTNFLGTHEQNSERVTEAGWLYVVPLWQ